MRKDQSTIYHLILSSTYGLPSHARLQQSQSALAAAAQEQAALGYLLRGVDQIQAGGLCRTCAPSMAATVRRV